MSIPTVSILIPCFNAEAYVAEAIESALAQDYPSIEILVLDDGSTDASLDVIRGFEPRENFRWETGPNRGGNAARNRLLKMAKGDYIQYLDADDLLAPNKLSRQMAEFEPGVDAVFCDCEEFSVGSEQSVRSIDYAAIGSDLTAYFVCHAVMIMSPVHLRRHLEAVGGFDETLPCCQEYDLHFRLAEQAWKNIVHVQERLTTRRSVPESVSSNESRVFSVKAKLVTSWWRRLLGKDRLSDATAEAMAETLYGSARHMARHGACDEARDAFRLAKRIAPTALFPATWPMRVLSVAVGPVRAERLREFFTRIL